MSMKLDAFEFYDCWLMFAIGFGKRGSSLRQILSTGDHYNRSVFMLDELNYGMSKLIENGYAVKKKEHFYTTSKAKAFYRQHSIIGESSIASLFRLSKIFQNEAAKQECELTIYFTQEAYRRACKLDIKSE